MKIWELMTKDVVTCRAIDTLQDAARQMQDRDLGALPVIDEHGRVAGIITDRDICMAACTRGEPLAAIAVSSAMSAPVATCSPDDDLTAVEAEMSERQLHRLPVVDGDARLVGIVTLNDFARAMRLCTEISPLGIASTVAAVAAPRPLLVAG